MNELNGRQESQSGHKTGMVRRLVALIRSWFELTAEEQAFLLIVIGLLLLGITVRYWRILHRN